MSNRVSPDPDRDLLDEDRIPSLRQNSNSHNDHTALVSRGASKGEGNKPMPVIEMASRPPTAKTNNSSDFVIGAQDSSDTTGPCSIILIFISYLLCAVTFPFSLCVCIKVVQEYERAVIFRLGRLLNGGAKGPGIFFVLPCIEQYTKVDLRTVSFDVPPQEVLTKDSVTVSVDAVVYYRIHNPTISVANVENASHSTQLLAQTALRNVLGTKNLSEILQERDVISHSMQETLDEATDRWGIRVERVEIKDVRLPVQLQRAMAAEAEAAREAKAKVIAAEGEQKASFALKEAAEVLSCSPAALQLRYLQTLNSISAEKNSTIIFPLPMDLMETFMKKQNDSSLSRTKSPDNEKEEKEDVVSIITEGMFSSSAESIPVKDNASARLKNKRLSSANRSHNIINVTSTSSDNSKVNTDGPNITRVESIKDDSKATGSKITKDYGSKVTKEKFGSNVKKDSESKVTKEDCGSKVTKDVSKSDRPVNTEHSVKDGSVSPRVLKKEKIGLRDVSRLMADLDKASVDSFGFSTEYPILRYY